MIILNNIICLVDFGTIHTLKITFANCKAGPRAHAGEQRFLVSTNFETPVVAVTVRMRSMAATALVLIINCDNNIKATNLLEIMATGETLTKKKILHLWTTSWVMWKRPDSDLLTCGFVWPSIDKSSNGEGCFEGERSSA